MCHCLAGVRRTPLLLLCLTSALVLCGAVSVPAAAKGLSDDLRKGLALLAKDIESFLKAEGREDRLIAVSGFTGPAFPQGIGGPEITKTLKEELKKRNLNIAEENGKKRPALTILGRYNDIQDTDSKKLAVNVIAQVTEGSKTLKEFEQAISGEETVTKLFAPSVQFTPETGKNVPDKKKDEETKKALVDENARNEKVKEALENPKTNVVKTLISVSPDSPYKIEILVAPKAGVAKDYVPIPAVNNGGQAFVSVKRDQFYAIRCYNDTPYLAAVKLTIDGLDVFSFKEEKVAPVFIIDPKSTVTVRGWYRTSRVSDSFLKTEYAKTAAAQLHNEANIGAITASFSAAWTKVPPPDEPEKPKGFRGEDGTGRGPALQEDYTIGYYFIGTVRATVSVRYNKAEESPADLPTDAPPKDAPPKDDPAKKAPPPKDPLPKDAPPP